MVEGGHETYKTVQNSTAIHNEAASNVLKDMVPNLNQTLNNATGQVEVIISTETLADASKAMWSTRWGYVTSLFGRAQSDPNLAQKVKDAAQATAEALSNTTDIGTDIIPEVVERECSTFTTWEPLPPRCQFDGSTATRLGGVVGRALTRPYDIMRDLWNAKPLEVSEVAENFLERNLNGQGGRGLTQPNHAYPYMYAYGQDYISGQF